MAIKIPIITVFDSKGLKSAQYQLNKVRGNFQNLGRNAAIAGAAIAGAFTLIGKAVMDAAEAQKVMTQTEAVLKSTGTVANGTAKDIANLSESLMRLTGVDDEAIQSGANLLLTFKNIQNQAGANNDIFNQTVLATLDVARAMGTDASTEAIRLGKALNDPVKGLTALGRVGIQFTQQQKDQIKALTESGDLMGAQKIILAELQSQFGGSAAAYVSTFAGQLELMRAELGNLSEDIGMIVMPAVQEFFGALRDIAPEAGARLKEALGSVDWKGFAKALSDSAIFLIQNAEAIIKVVGALFVLNTTYNLIKVTAGLANAVMALGAIGLGSTAIAAGTATRALLLFRGALMLTGIGAVIVALGLIIQGVTELDSSYRKTTPVVTSFGTAVLNSGKDAQWAASRYGVAANAAKDLANATAGIKPGRTSVLDDYAYGLKTNVKKKKATDPMAEFWKNLDKGSSGTSTAKEAGKKAGANFVDGVALAAKANAKKLQEILTKFTEATPVKDEWTEFGSTLGNQIISGLSKSIEKIGSFIGEGSIKAFKSIYKKAAALQDAFVARTKFQTELKENIMSMFDFQNIKTGLSGIIKQFKTQVEQTKKFRDNLIELQKLGLSGELFRKIAEAQDFATAAELVKGGAGAVGEINSLYGELQGFSNEIATVSGNALYNLGVDSATGFVRTLEEGFVSLKSLADVERKKAQVIAAQNAANALTPFNSGLNPDQIKAIQKKAAEDYQYYLGRFVDPITGQRREGILRGSLQNAQLRTNLDQYFLGGGQMNGNIANQLAYLDLGRSAQITADRAAREQARAERYGRSINVNVSGGISTSAQIGQSVVEAIRAYERSSGQVYASA